MLLRLSAGALVMSLTVMGVLRGAQFALLSPESSHIKLRKLKMIDKKILFASFTALSLSFSASVLSDASAADELMAALKACKADAAAMKSAQAMIRKHGGKSSDDQIDDWVDDQDDKLFDCLDKKL
ncbi:MAG: hypothetical protein CBC82_08410 [Cellvibrionales bacterium TMED122]|nr:MAG: hypothetical protein CBC82_08410 [Cellvibrionales bacterium TMED122]|tara:strand:- start:89 stop:466 length:378 start_codon:yes stop_codon:yes gene_type:complete